MSEYQPPGGRKWPEIGPKSGFDILKNPFLAERGRGSTSVAKMNTHTKNHHFSFINGRDSTARPPIYYLLNRGFSERFSRPPPPSVESRAHLLVRTSGPSDSAGRPFGPAGTVVGPTDEA